MHLFYFLLFSIFQGGINHTATIIANYQKQSLVLKGVHTFRDKSKNILGNVYINEVANNKDVFDYLLIINNTNAQIDTLYRIDRSNFEIMKGRHEIEMTASNKNFLGYKIVLKKQDYIVITYVTKEKEHASDITIEWNYDDKMFKILRMP